MIGRTRRGSRLGVGESRGAIIALGGAAWVVGMLWIFPVAWTLLTSFKTEQDASAQTLHNGLTVARYSDVSHSTTGTLSLSAAFTNSLVVVLVWQWTPFMMLIMLAGLQSQPSDILEAAGVDGATPIGIFRQLTLPHLRRYLELGALLGSIYIVQAFDAIDVMTGGGPGSTNVPYFVYQESIGGGFRYGSASAYAIVVVVFAIIIATFALRLLSGLLKDEERA